MVPRIRSRSWVGAPLAEVFAFFDDPANLDRLTPPPVSIRVVRIAPKPPRPGSLIEFSYGIGPIRRSWIIRLVERVEQGRIVDETLSGPMQRFDHRHSFSPAQGGGTWIEDEIEYHVGPDGPIGAVVDFAAGLVMRLTFIWRAARQRQLLGQ